MGGPGCQGLTMIEATGPADCTDGGGTWNNAFINMLAGEPSCFFNDEGSIVASNTFIDNRGFAQPTNRDLADLSDFSLIGIPAAAPGQGNCWRDNVDPSGITS